jgi:peptidylprolyl isomerase
MVRSLFQRSAFVRISCLLFLCLTVIIPFSITQAQESNVKSTTVVLETNQGNIEITLFTDKAPKTVENFVGLIKKGYYNGLIFHRVIKGFMIQGGDPTGTGSGGTSLWGKDFADEISPDLAFDKPGILAMANRGPDTNGSQFFITTAPTTWLNGHHTIFGVVSQGYDVVSKIEGTPTGTGDRPVQDQKILKAYVK